MPVIHNTQPCLAASWLNRSTTSRHASSATEHMHTIVHSTAIGTAATGTHSSSTSVTGNRWGLAAATAADRTKAIARAVAAYVPAARRCDRRAPPPPSPPLIVSMSYAPFNRPAVLARRCRAATATHAMAWAAPAAVTIHSTADEHSAASPQGQRPTNVTHRRNTM